MAAQQIRYCWRVAARALRQTHTALHMEDMVTTATEDTEATVVVVTVAAVTGVATAAAVIDRAN